MVKILCLHCRGHGFDLWSENEDAACRMAKNRTDTRTPAVGGAIRFLSDVRAAALWVPASPFYVFYFPSDSSFLVPTFITAKHPSSCHLVTSEMLSAKKPNEQTCSDCD